MGDRKDSTSAATKVMAVAVVGMWLLVAFLPWIALRTDGFDVSAADYTRLKDRLPQFGVYGDMFGSINALFSALALLGVVYAVLLQRQELHDQREQARRDDAASNAATDRQFLAMSIQAIAALATSLAMNQEEEAAIDAALKKKAEDAMATNDFRTMFMLLDQLPRRFSTLMLNRMLMTMVSEIINRLGNL